MQKIWNYIFIFLSLIVISLAVALVTIDNRDLKVVFCDVGQGDGVLISLGKNQILVDGGVGGKVVDCLSKSMTFWDREIELVINTHPQKDHYGGLIDLARSYTIKTFITTGLNASSSDFQVLEDALGGEHGQVLYVENLNAIRLGLMQLDILHPSKNFILSHSEVIDTDERSVLGKYQSKEDPNIFSIVGVLSYKNFDVLLTGDIEKDILERLAASNSNIFNKIEILKVPHHGSKNGLSDEILKKASFSAAAISCGRNNNYGHPHKEVLDLLEAHNIKTMRTDQEGTIVIKSDGESWWRN